MTDSTDPTQLTALLPVVEVTLLEDRGLVRRRGHLVIPPGRSRLIIDGIAPVLADKTLAVQLCAEEGATLPSGLRASDLSVKRWRVQSNAGRPAEVAAVNEQVRAMERTRVATRRRLVQIEGDAESLAAIVELTLGELAQDVSWGRDELSEADQELDDLEAKIEALGLQACAVRKELRTVERDLNDLRTMAAAHDSPDADARASLTVALSNATASDQRVVMQLDYLVPGALWRPCHTARLVSDATNPRIAMETQGCVWQATGEDWTEVQVIFSTERPSLGVSPPVLATDRLHARKRGSQVQVAAREQTIHTAGLGQDETATQAEDEMPGIDDGGASLSLRARSRVTIPSDGRPHRIPIATFESSAESSLICVPELAAAVLLRTRQANTSAQPLLAGPVDLVRDSGLVGRTSILYIAAGEAFDLGWGPDRALRVHRDVEFLDETRRALSSWRRKPRRVKITISNLGAQSAKIEVKERIATSEIEKVEVELDSASYGARPDTEGVVSWTAQLGSFGHEALQVDWTLVVHDDVTGL